MIEKIYTHWKNRSIKDIEGEIWEPVPDFNGRYDVSNFGRVKSNRIIQGINDGESILNVCPFILKQYMDKGGYLRVALMNNKKNKSILVHVIVCKVFKKNVLNKQDVHHIKNVRSYNVATNLEWKTRKENVNEIPLSKGIVYNVIDVCKPEDSLYNIKKSTPGKSYIYAILDKSDLPIYVGKSNTPIQRFRQHKTCAKGDNFEKWNLGWLREILLTGGKVSLRIIKEINEDEWQKWEKHYISLYKKKGYNLFNISAGGNDRCLSQALLLQAANDIRKKPILQYNLDGEFIKEWPSTGDAKNSLCLTKQGITRTLKGRRLSSGGFLWRYKVDGVVPSKIEAHYNKNHVNIQKYL